MNLIVLSSSCTYVCVLVKYFGLIWRITHVIPTTWRIYISLETFHHWRSCYLILLNTICVDRWLRECLPTKRTTQVRFPVAVIIPCRRHGSHQTTLVKSGVSWCCWHRGHWTGDSISRKGQEELDKTMTIVTVYRMISTSENGSQIQQFGPIRLSSRTCGIPDSCTPKPA